MDIASWWAYQAADTGLTWGITIPSGIIMPFNDVSTNIPTGWSHFSSIANKAVLVTNTTSEVGNTGGSTYANLTSGSVSNHSGNSFVCWLAPTTAGGGADAGSAARGSHSHSLRGYYTPARRLQVLMKATSDHETFPAKTAILGESAFTQSGFTDITADGYMLYGTSGTSSSNSGSSKSGSNVNTTGGHWHGTGDGVLGTAGNAYRLKSYSEGASSHSASISSVTDNLYRFYLGMWANASAAMAAEPGMYGLWESATPPTGWAICDGNNGTTDLTGYMIGLSTNGTLRGTTAGTGQVTFSGSLATNGSHNHRGSYTYVNTRGSIYHSANYSHSHTISQTKNYTPQYYKLVIIKALTPP